MKHTEEAKRKIGAASKQRGSAAIALNARWSDRAKLCSVDGCDGVHEAKGFCNMHYMRWRKSGATGGAKSFYSDDGYIDPYGYMIKDGARVHVMVAERALGKRLPEGAVVHHVNENKLDNCPANLVICQDRAYHNLLHARMRALDECGHVNWLKCPFCLTYDDPKNMYVYPNKRAAKHRECYASYRQGRKC